MPLNWPKIPKIEDVVGQLDGVEARLKSLEQLVNSQGLMIGAQGTTIGDLGGKVAALRTGTDEAQKAIGQNTQAVQAVLTVLHPDPEHPAVPDTVPHGAWLHDLMMKWIETYGRLTPPRGQ